MLNEGKNEPGYNWTLSVGHVDVCDRPPHYSAPRHIGLRKTKSWRRQNENGRLEDAHTEDKRRRMMDACEEFCTNIGVALQQSSIAVPYGSRSSRLASYYCCNYQNADPQSFTKRHHCQILYCSLFQRANFPTLQTEARSRTNVTMQDSW